MSQTPLVEMNDIHKRFGGVHAVNGVSIDLYPGEVVGILGHNGAGKTVLMKSLSGAIPCDAGEIRINGEKARIESPRDARKHGIETIYQTLALADNLNAPANLFLGREIMTNYGTLDDRAMESEARTVISRLNPNFKNITDAVKNMSGGQRQSVAIARAIYFNAKILIMDEPTAALGPHETAMVSELIKQLKKEGIGIFLISHDLHDVFDLSDRVSVIKNGRLIGTRRTQDVTKDEVLGMIIMGKLPD
ncbi:MAG: ATP-binding cassette domain-containing protein [Desulfobacterales bacterium]|nr:ATP-binding cassette domain-containing protein [Desulfobacterales bacterium]